MELYHNTKKSSPILTLFPIPCSLFPVPYSLFPFSINLMFTYQIKILYNQSS
ncbi:hypothetical protein [Moorena producens]|uniref:hypothetical protein n=1 Tax=Moorena producens TaxID=1155739 RepID=UPI0013146B74|nr:hypothetical protein [Moorena producens]